MSDNTKAEQKNKDDSTTHIRLSELTSWSANHPEVKQARVKADRIKPKKKRMKLDKKRTGAFLILFGVGIPIVLWIFFGEAGGSFSPDLLIISEDVEINFKYVRGIGALTVLWGIGLILSSLFPRRAEKTISDGEDDDETKE